MSSIQVAVGIYHFAFEPEPEFHANRFDLVDQLAEPLWPNRVADDPVAQTGAVVASGTEPTVVEHEAFDSDFSGCIGESGQFVVVVVEINRFPNVEGYRARANVGRMSRASANHAVQSVACAVDSVARINRYDRRGLVALAACEHNFARQQQLVGGQRCASNRGALDQVTVVARPCKAQAPSLTALKGCTLGERKLNQGVVVTGSAFATLANPLPNVDGVALWLALTHPSPVKIENLFGVVRHWQEGRQRFDVEVCKTEVGD